MFTKFDAIVALVKDPSFILEEDNSITWLSTDKTQPTETEIEAKIIELQAAEPLRQLRIKRNQLLTQTDWRMTTDYPYNDQPAWASYRTALRNLPATSEPTLDEQGNLTGITWPTPPSD